MRPVSVADLQRAFDRLRDALGEGSSNQRASAAMANLAEGIQGLVTHMRSEQQIVRDWMQTHANDQKELKRLLEQVLRERGPV